MKARQLFWLAILYLAVVDNALTVFGGAVQRRVLPSLEWNWLGKFASLGLACLLVARSNWLSRNAGLQLRQAPGSMPLSMICLGLCLVYGIFGGFISAPRPLSVETLLFEATMPSLAEELAFRGIGLALLERSFHADAMSGRLRFGRAALISSLIFGLGHGLSFGRSGFHVEVAPVLATFVIGGVLALCRTRSRSLAWPILCHSAVNLPIFAIAMMRA